MLAGICLLVFKETTYCTLTGKANASSAKINLSKFAKSEKANWLGKDDSEIRKRRTENLTCDHIQTPP